MSKTTLNKKKCLVCGKQADIVESFNNMKIIAQIETALGAKGLGLAMDTYPINVLRRCSSCGLEFADPMVEPGVKFYQWLTNSGFSYPESRWEWTACRDLLVSLQSRQKSSILLADVGCGQGSFLQMLKGIPRVNTIGIEPNPDVVKKCHAIGLDVILGGLNEISSKFIGNIDIFTFWHVVEHVADPVGMLRQARGLLSQGGMLYFSVPISPLSHEHSYPDPFNVPPHHLTRWTISSLEALAEQLDMNIDISLPLAQPLLQRTIRSLSLQSTSHIKRKNRIIKLILLISFLFKNPTSIIKEFMRQINHPTLNKRTLPDVALVCLKNF